MKIMRTVLFVLATVSVSGSADAQLIKDFGIKIGATISHIRLTDEKPIYIGGQPHYLEFIQGNVVNPSMTLFVNWVNTEHLTLQTELTFLRKGASKTYVILVTTEDNPDGNGTEVTFTQETGLRYLELGVNLQPKYPLGDVVVYATAGPTFSYLVGSNMFASGNQLSKVQVGYSIGVGTSYKNLFVETKYAGDFRYFYDHPFAKSWNRLWMFCIGTTI